MGLGIEFADRYPPELSGGQSQRVNIARVLDEPTSALDVSLRVRVMLLFEELRQRHGLPFLFTSHDLATVRYLASRVAVVSLGIIVEEAEATAFRSAAACARCPLARPICSEPVPYREVTPGHFAACHLLQAIGRQRRPVGNRRLVGSGRSQIRTGLRLNSLQTANFSTIGRAFPSS